MFGRRPRQDYIAQDNARARSGQTGPTSGTGGGISARGEATYEVTASHYNPATRSVERRKFRVRAKTRDDAESNVRGTLGPTWEAHAKLVGA